VPRFLTLPIALAACAALLPGCAQRAADAPPQPRLVPTADWRSIATADDRRRLREWRTAWTQALARAEAAGHGADIAREGALLRPDAALAGAVPPPGDYLCRTLKLGAQGPGGLDFIAYSPFLCRIRVEDGLMSFAKLSGSQRPLGLLFEDSERRMIFLGTLQLGDERHALQYGRDRERDMAGMIERVDERRWRLVFPYPHFESLIDVIELVPRTGA
jgi:hypothetical protein